MRFSGQQLREQYKVLQEHQRRLDEGMFCAPGCLCESEVAVAEYLLRSLGLDPAVAPAAAWEDVAEFLSGRLG